MKHKNIVKVFVSRDLEKLNNALEDFFRDLNNNPYINCHVATSTAVNSVSGQVVLTLNIKMEDI